jgi:apolipoprotein N-acyltransferase
VTGLWGVTFLIAWFASIVNWLWEENFDFVKVWKGAGFYLCLLVSVHLYGGIYMAFAPADADTVRIASVTRSFDMDVEAQKCRRDSSCLGRLFEKSLTEFIGSSKRAVDMGASIVLWQENGVAVFADDEAKFVDAAAEFSTQESIFLVMSVKVVADKKSDDENKAILISPQGERAEYLKNYQVAGDEHILGDGSILIRSSIHGTLGTIICKDFDYPDFVRQAGLAEVDIMLIPSHDWRAIDPYHARMAHLRAIENGYSMISANYHGTSTAIDFHGNALGLTSDFKTDELIMLSDIPTQGIRTIYSVIGDLFAWLNGVMLAGMIYVAWRRG